MNPPTNSSSGPSGAPDMKTLLQLYPTRELKLARIGEIDKRLAKWEREDEENDPELIRGHIGLTRGFRLGCGTFFLCFTALSGRVVWDGRRWAWFLVILSGLAGLIMIVRGLAYRPDPKLILASYDPHRAKNEYRDLMNEMETLSRALAQDLRAGDDVS